MTTTSEIDQLKAAHRATWASGDYHAVAEAFVRDAGLTAVARPASSPVRRCSTSPPAPGTRRSPPRSRARA